MSRGILLVFSNPVDGREEEYNAWYTEHHLDEILAIDGFVLAQRFRLADDARMTRDTPDAPYRYLAFYEAEDRERADSALFELARRERAEALAAGRTPKLVMSPAMDPDLRTWWYESISEPRS
ncbi:hypothetical protein ACL02T_27885 [Pseudonocardia sp. RS010]|uniref:hypothetical protein n=1 Tax=Pseudonocardia sp. RS010 TaxID=3385979 RepID=UPI0039A00CAD